MSVGGVLAAGIAAAGSLAGGMFTNQANANLNYRNRVWQEEMWNKQNAYNSPAAVLQRYADAGINVNPNYLVTGSSYDMGLASHVSTPHQEGYKDPSTGLANSLSLYLQSKQLENETKVAESQVNLNNSQAEKNDVESAGRVNENRYFLDNYETSLNKQKEELNMLKKNGLILDKDYEIRTQELNKKIAEVHEAKSRAAKADEEVNTQKAVTANVESQTESEKHRQNLMDAERTKALADADMARRQGRYYDAAALLAKSNVAKNEAEKREINSRIQLNQGLYEKALADAGLSDEQAAQVVEMTRQAVLNGRTDRYVKELQKYGNNVIATAANIMEDLFTSDADKHKSLNKRWSNRVTKVVNKLVPTGRNTFRRIKNHR